MPRILSSRDIGRLLGVDASSVNRWIDAGRLPAYRTPGGHRRVLEADLVSFVLAQGLPMPAELQGAGEAPVEAEPEPVWILVCESDEQQRRNLSRALRAGKSRPVQVLPCSSALAAMLQIGAYRPNLLVLDGQMPGLDWVEVCRAIAATPETRETRVVVALAKPSASVEARYREAGAAAVMAKPVRAAAVLGLLE